MYFAPHAVTADNFTPATSLWILRSLPSLASMGWMTGADPRYNVTVRPAHGIQRFPSPLLDLFIKRDFLNAEECAGLMARIDANRRPSVIADVMDNDASFRTSETCDLSATDPFVAAIDRKISEFAGIDPIYGEPLQGQRYAVGQEFKAHTDYFEPEGADFASFCSVSGNRTWTVMVYLNRPEAGGATRFTRIDKMVHPETGKLLCWNNRLPDGGVNVATMHHGMKVRAGTKYIITKWYRERPWG